MFADWKIESLPSSEREAEGRMVTLSVKNTGEVAWLPNGRNGHVELVVIANDGREIRRQPLIRGVRPGTEIPWRFFLDSEEAGGESILSIQVRVNDIIMNEGKQPLRLNCGDLEIGDVVTLASTLSPPADGSLHIEQDYMLVGGWGAVERNRRGLTLWSAGGESTIGFFLHRPETLTLVATAFPFRGKGFDSGENSIIIYCNGEKIGTVIRLDRARGFTVNIPQDHLQQGINRLRFEYGSMEPEYRRVGQDVIFRFRTRAVAFTYVSLRRIQSQ